MSLLTIPREIRDKILNLIISPYIPAPHEIPNLNNRATLNDFKQQSPYFHGDNVLYIENHQPSDALTLLLVNHQIYAETVDAIKRLPTRLSYILDVIIAQEQNLLPTWLYLPVICTTVDKIYCQFRSLGLPQGRRGLFRGGCGGPPAMTWALLNLIERYLRVGPVGRQEGKIDRRYGVKELIIDIRTPDVSSELIAPVQRHRGISIGREETPSLMRNPNSIAKYMLFDLDMIMRMSGDYGWNGKIIFERVGSIKVLLDGERIRDEVGEEVVSEWDVADVLAGLKYSPYWGDYAMSKKPEKTRREEWDQWVNKAWESRVELGLPVKEKVLE